MFQPIQLAAVSALRECDEAPGQICALYQKRRDWLVEALREAGWPVTPPQATMFLWTRIPEPFREMGSLEFAKMMMREARVALSPGMGFGPMGEGFVRFSLIEDEARTREAARRIGSVLKNEKTPSGAALAEVNV
jgi:alanine-synthesizing transaminase